MHVLDGRRRINEQTRNDGHFVCDMVADEIYDFFMEGKVYIFFHVHFTWLELLSYRSADTSSLIKPQIYNGFEYLVEFLVCSFIHQVVDLGRGVRGGTQPPLIFLKYFSVTLRIRHP